MEFKFKVIFDNILNEYVMKIIADQKNINYNYYENIILIAKSTFLPNNYFQIKMNKNEIIEIPFISLRLSKRKFKNDYLNRKKYEVVGKYNDIFYPICLLYIKV